MEVIFEFKAPLFLWDTKAGSWVFARLPLEVAEEIRDVVPDTPGFGSVKVEARIGASVWKTSVFPEAATGSFVLPVKKAIRSAESIEPGDDVPIELVVALP